MSCHFYHVRAQRFRGALQLPLDTLLPVSLVCSAGSRCHYEPLILAAVHAHIAFSLASSTRYSPLLYGELLRRPPIYTAALVSIDFPHIARLRQEHFSLMPRHAAIAFTFSLRFLRAS